MEVMPETHIKKSQYQESKFHFVFSTPSKLSRRYAERRKSVAFTLGNLLNPGLFSSGDMTGFKKSA